MKRQILLAAILIFTLNSFCQNTDYRDAFTGEFQGILYVHEYGFPDYSISDTIQTIIRIEKFHGYTIGDDSNYVDVVHKLAITFDTIHSEVNVFKCSGPVYILDGFIHPTTDTLGNLSYPELENCSDTSDNTQQTGYLYGFINSDSIKVEYGYSDKWGGLSRKIIGKRVINKVDDVQLSNKELLVYPNPADNFIVFKNLPAYCDVTIYSADGKVMYAISKTSENKINISSFPQGMYFIKVTGFNSNYTLKLIKK